MEYQTFYQLFHTYSTYNRYTKLFTDTELFLYNVDNQHFIHQFKIKK